MAKAIECKLILHGGFKQHELGTFPSKAAARKYAKECWDRPYTIKPIKTEKK